MINLRGRVIPIVDLRVKFGLKAGATVLERIAAHSTAYDVIITDHQMPNMSGLDLVMRLRSIDFGIKIFVHYSPLDRQAADHYRSLLVDEILYKPMALDALLKTVGT